MKTRDRKPQSLGATQRAIEAMHGMIMERRLSAGAQIHQEELAQRIGVSRIPVREALKALQSEGLVSHSPNRGFFVTRLNAQELRQLYLMREVLETEVLKRIDWPDSTQISALRTLNASLLEAGRNGSISTMTRLNRQLHFTIFSLSNLEIIVREVERIWRISEAYRALYLIDRSERRRVVREHAGMIDALVKRDRKKLITLTERHRQTANDRVLSLLNEVP